MLPVQSWVALVTFSLYLFIYLIPLTQHAQQNCKQHARNPPIPLPHWNILKPHHRLFLPSLRCQMQAVPRRLLSRGRDAKRIEAFEAEGFEQRTCCLVPLLRSLRSHRTRNESSAARATLYESPILVPHSYSMGQRRRVSVETTFVLVQKIVMRIVQKIVCVVTSVGHFHSDSETEPSRPLRGAMKTKK